MSKDIFLTGAQTEERVYSLHRNHSKTKQRKGEGNKYVKTTTRENRKAKQSKVKQNVLEECHRNDSISADSVSLADIHKGNKGDSPHCPF